MIHSIRSLLYRINLIKKPVPHDGLLRSKNLVIGKNCSLDRLSIVFDNPRSGITNIVIGDDCIIEGRIIIHNNNAKVTIGNGVFIGHSSEIISYKEIEIGNDVMLSWGVTLIDTNAHSLISEERKDDVRNWQKGPGHKDWSNVTSERIVIEDNCWLGFNSIILKGITLGRGCVVAAGSVVTKDVKPFFVVGGNPAKFIKETY